jgi:cytochrome c556
MTRALIAVIVASIGPVMLADGSVTQAPAPAAAPRRLVPVAASTLANAPDSFYGQIVSVTAAVERMLSASAFVVHGVLVIAPTLTGPVDPKAYVTVVGEALRFDPAEIAGRVKDYTLDLAPDVIAGYNGRPAILATAVVNAALVDLARRPPPPLSAEEAAYDKVMKRVGPAFNDLRTAVTASDAAATAEHTKVLTAAFAEAEAFWKARAAADALAWTTTALAQVTAIERAAGAGNWDQVKTSAGELNRTCQACHTAYRERLDDGSFRVKSGGASAR